VLCLSNATLIRLLLERELAFPHKRLLSHFVHAFNLISREEDERVLINRSRRVVGAEKQAS